MKLHNTDELVSLLQAAIQSVGMDESFLIKGVESPPDRAGWVIIKFTVDGLTARMDRDRGEIDIFLKASDGAWYSLNQIRDTANKKLGSFPPVKSKELFDPGYTENEAISESVTSLSKLRSYIK